MSTLQSDLQTKPSTSSAAAEKPKYKGKTGAASFTRCSIGPHKVEYMFGYPGGAILPVFDELYKTPAKFILNRHEQASGHCADGYARVTGKPASASSPPAPARRTPSPRWPPPRWTRSR
jgi:hypothetical protein